MYTTFGVGFPGCYQANRLQAQQAYWVLVLHAQHTHTAFSVPGGVGLNLVYSERGLSIWGSFGASDNPCRQAPGVWCGEISCTDKKFPTVWTFSVDWWSTSIFCILTLRRSQYFWRARASSSTSCFNGFRCFKTLIPQLIQWIVV